MRASRVAAVGLLLAAVVWVGSGHFLPSETRSAAVERPANGDTPFRVGVVETREAPHRRRLVLSGRTEADRKVTVMARTAGIIREVRVKKGDRVEQGDILAVLSDEAHDAQVARARALLEQKRREREAREQLIQRGTLPRLQIHDLEAQEKAAEAALALAEAERERLLVRAPWPGVVNAVPAEVGQGIASGPIGSANEIAQLLSLDPIVAVAELSERHLADARVGARAEIRLVTGETVAGTVRYISRSASATTRTYRVDVAAPNADGRIPDGITVEVTILLEPVLATRVPRSALIFSARGELGVRVVRGDDTVDFLPVTLVEDEQQFMWVAGVGSGTRLIVRGQDFVREGQRVEAVAAPDVQTARQ